MKRVIAIATALVLVVLGGGLFKLATAGSGQTHITAHFTKAIGLYKGSTVRVLGVEIGKVTKVTPQGETVRVEMTVPTKQKIPADAQAVIVPPSVVSDRYVQLTPVYSAGPVMADHTDIPVGHTGIPVELDQILANLDQLNVALGPSGANSGGALSRLVTTGARNLGGGNGERLNAATHNLSELIATLDDNKDNLFGVVDNLAKFSTALATNDQSVRAFNNDLADVSIQLNGERQDLAAALRNLGFALGQVGNFVKQNKGELTTDIAGLTNITNTLVKQKQALTEFADVSPLALQNLNNAYDPQTQTLRTRNNSEQANNPALALCQLVQQISPGASTNFCKGVNLNNAPGLLSGILNPAASLPRADRTLGGVLSAPGGSA